MAFSTLVIQGALLLMSGKSEMRNNVVQDRSILEDSIGNKVASGPYAPQSRGKLTERSDDMSYYLESSFGSAGNVSSKAEVNR